MKAFAEAPSKAIVTGEHFVVHGALALATALPRRVHVEMKNASSLTVSSDKFEKGSRQLVPVCRVVESMAKEHEVSSKVNVYISSDVPGGAGFGSSAATMVAVAAAFSELNSLSLRTDEIVRFAMVGEQSIHGRPSGIDPAVCAYGGVVLFKTGSPPKKVVLDGTRTLILSFSGIDRETRGQIGRVSKTKEKHPEVFSKLSEWVSELSREAAEKLRTGDGRGLGTLLTLNHVALMSLGVSCDALDGMVDLLLSLGSYGAKLTGAGGGGSVLAVAPEAKEKSIVSGLTARGFETFKLRVPTEGVRSWSER